MEHDNRPDQHFQRSSEQGRPSPEVGQPTPDLLGQSEQLSHDGGLNAPEPPPPKGGDADFEWYLERRFGTEEDEAGKVDLRTLFDERESAPLSWRTYLRDTLGSYLDEYPFMRDDVDTLEKLDMVLQAPLEPPEWMYATGVYDADQEWVAKEQDRQIREILEQAKLKHSSENNPDIQ